MPAVTLSQLESYLLEGNLSIPLYVGTESTVVREETAEYRTNGPPAALSAWLQSYAAVRQSLQGLLASK